MTSITVVAEAFGFGPAAAAVQLGEALVADGFDVRVAGSGHALELAMASSTPFELMDLDKVSVEHAVDGSAGVISAMDLMVAEDTVAAGVPTVLYDALAWFWSATPPAVTAGASWLCQDFFGVRAAADRAAADGCVVEVVAPITKPVVPRVRDGRPVLNLGGIANPLWPKEVVLAYARWAADAAAATCGSELLVLSSSAVVDALRGDGFDARTVAPLEAVRLLERAPLVFATPGLGNLYDAAAALNPTVWLPAANDSQARQIDVVLAADAADAAIRWSDLGCEVSATGRPQSEILAELADCVLRQPPALRELLADAAERVRSSGRLRIELLAQMFPAAGPEPAARKAAAMLGLTVDV